MLKRRRCVGALGKAGSWGSNVLFDDFVRINAVEVRDCFVAIGEGCQHKNFPCHLILGEICEVSGQFNTEGVQK